MKVLIIEDNEQNLYLLRYLLESARHVVISAQDSETAFARLKTALPDIILLDIQLPGMDGHQIARLLRLNPVLDTTPIVAITSYAMNGDRLRALAAGCDDYLEKPVNPDTFVQQIENIATTGRNSNEIKT